MATSTYTATSISTAGSQFYLWAHPISAFMATAGWIQTADTGQVVWPVSIFNITDALENGGNTAATFTGTITAGTTPLRIGMSVQVTGTTNFGTAAAPVTWVITGGNLTTTFTANGTALGGAASHDTPAANIGWGSVNPQVSITNAIGNTSSNTFTYSLLDGPDPINGQSIVVTGCTTAGFNATWTIASVNTGAKTFTTTTGITHATEVETGTGIVTCNRSVIAASGVGTATLPPAPSNSVYEIWKMNDGNSFPVILRINYGASATPSPLLSVVLMTSTDGAGNAAASTGTSGTLNIFSSSGTLTAQNSYMSGSTNRMHWALWPLGTASTSPGGFLNLERSHDNNGNDTTSGQYATICTVGNNVSGVAQSSITSLNQTVTETRLPSLVNHTTATGSFGLSTILAPVFPIVGAVGNPMIGLQVGKFVDWANATQFSYTMYNVAHNYIILVNNSAGTWGTAGSLLYDGVPNCSLAIRYE